MMRKITSKNNSIYVGSDVKTLIKLVIRNYFFSKKFILVDENTRKHCLPFLKDLLKFFPSLKIIVIHSGEKGKNIETAQKIWETLAYFNADRNSVLINLGGGVICDLGGFAASTYMRGIDFINLPTTLLAQVDASVGGKSGINLFTTKTILKNQIGTFCNPKAVFVFPEFLKTLNSKEIFSGFAEIIKHALIKDKILWKYIKDLFPQPNIFASDEKFNKIIFQSIKIKNEIVQKDPFDQGLRKVLNFGHTIGHAVESFSLKNDRKPLLHGEAIAIGMICEAYLSHKISGLKRDQLNEISSFISKKYTPYKINRRQTQELLILMGKDKKNKNENINFSLLPYIGNCLIDQNCNRTLILESLEFYNNLSDDKQ